MQSKYEVLEVVGEGAFGIVMKCRNKETNEIVAIKKFKGFEEEVVQKSMIRELKALKRLKHDNIVQLKDCFKKKGQLYLAIEYLPRNLLQLLEMNPDGLDQSLIKKIMYQLSKALLYMHNNDLIHRDIKPENILLSDDNNVKLCDFGFARALPQKTGALTDYVATRWYRAPELLLGVPNYGKEVDYWAMGCIMGELIDGRPMFPGDDELSQLNVIQSILGNYDKDLLETFHATPRYAGSKLDEVSKPETLKRRYMGMMSKNGLDYMKGLLNVNARERLSGVDIINHPYFDDFREEEGGCGIEGGCDNEMGDNNNNNNGNINQIQPGKVTINQNGNVIIKKCMLGNKENKENKENGTKQMNNYEKRIHKLIKATNNNNNTQTKSPPHEIISQRHNIYNPNITANGFNTNNINSHPTSTTNKKAMNNHPNPNTNPIPNNQTNLRFDHTQTAMANQQLLETFYHHNNNDQYNFEINVFPIEKKQRHQKSSKHTAAGTANTTLNINPLNQPDPTPTVTPMSYMHFIQNEPKLQSRIPIAKQIKQLHMDEIANQFENEYKYPYNFLPQIQVTNRNVLEDKRKNNNLSNYNY